MRHHFPPGFIKNYHFQDFYQSLTNQQWQEINTDNYLSGFIKHYCEVQRAPIKIDIILIKVYELFIYFSITL